MRFEGKRPSVNRIVHNIRYMVSSSLEMLVFKSFSSDKHLKDLQSFGLFPTIKARSFKFVKWIPPDTGLVLNVDGASKGKGNPGICGGGGCIRDSLGNLLLAFAHYYGFGGSLVAEIRSLLSTPSAPTNLLLGTACASGVKLALTFIIHMSRWFTLIDKLIGLLMLWLTSLLSQSLARLTPTPTGESEEDVSRPSSSLEPRRSGAGLRPVCGRRTRIKYVVGLTGLVEVFRHSWYQSKKFEMVDRRDWGGGGDDPEESIQRMIERIWESLTDIQRRMDQQAPVPLVAVPPGAGETVPIAPVPPGVEVPFVAPVPPPPPVLLVEEPVMQVEKFLRLQPPTYSGGPNPDTAEHWVHEIERVFATMRFPTADKVVLAAYQLRGFALEWWRLKMRTTFAGRTEEVITWPEFLNVFNDTFFPTQMQQVKREQFRTLQQGNSSVLEYQMRFMALSRYAPYVVSDNNMMVEYFIRGLKVELQDAIVPLMCKTVEEAAQRAATLERSIRTRQVKEEDGEVVSNFSKVVVDQRWRNRSRVLPGSPLFHQGIDVIIAISWGI
ncbi:hypothetical protein Taro_022470 [Colocasia esculenta]|uniref:Retrotransposon gag domain-containing protein n=1 Tax=Colocasia esculenta TaxID=4460 RepID=A0A843V1N4_COLES|nr:hypothetical protein [Colocasia esculenta]